MSLIPVLVLFAIWSTQDYRPLPLPRVDQAERDPSLLAFRTKLVGVTERRALDELVIVTELGVEIDSPGTKGRDLFRYHIQQGGEAWWRALARALSLGGTFTTARGAVIGRREFCAPYVYSTFPKELPPLIGKENPTVAIIGTHVAVRAARSEQSRVVARFSEVLVNGGGERVDEPGPNLFTPPWVSVEYEWNKFGWVAGRYAYEPESWRVCMANPNGSWLVSQFVRGPFEIRR